MKGIYCNFSARGVISIDESVSPAADTSNLYLNVSTDQSANWTSPIDATVTCNPTCSNILSTPTNISGPPATVPIGLSDLTAGTEYTISTASVNGSGLDESDTNYTASDSFCTG